MSIVGSYLFSKLVLPAIAVQAKEADIDEGHHSVVAPVASVPVNPMYGPGQTRDQTRDNLTSITGMAAAPAFASRRNLNLARMRSANQSMPDSTDPLMSELMQFRAWQAAQRGGGAGALTPIQGGNTPLGRRDSFSANALSPNPYPFPTAAPSTVTAHTARGSPQGAIGGGTTNIIVVNSGSGTNYRPSNLGLTSDPGYTHMQGAPDMSMLTLHEGGLGSGSGVSGLGGVGGGGGSALMMPTVAEMPVIDLDAAKQEEEMRKEAELNGTAADPSQLKLDVNDYPSSIATVTVNPSNTTPTAMNTIEQVKIVPVIEDGKLVNKQVTHNVTYSNDQLYTAATQFYHRLLAEALGTWALVFFIAGVNIEASLGHLDQMGVAIASGLVFVFLIYSLGQVSGAHFNPIVTYAFVLRGMFPLTWLPFYWVVQFVGALVGAAMLLGFYGATIGDAGATIVPDAYSEKAGFLMEAVLCFVLVFAILSMASRAKIVGPHAALAIGAVISFNVFLAGSYSGASMNPWRSVCVSIVFPVTFYSIWVYFAGPFLGATIAVVAVFALAGKPRNDELTAGIGATIAVAIGNSISREVEGNESDAADKEV